MKTLQALHAFDLDNTLLNNNCSYRFGRYLCQQNYLSYSALIYIIATSIKFKTGLISIQNLHQGAFQRLFLGKLEADIKMFVDKFLEANFLNMLYQPAVEKLKAAQRAGHLTAILSSSPDFLVSKIAARLHIPVWEATQYAVDKDGRFCHISKLVMGHEKAQILGSLCRQHQIESNETFAYSDSHLDLPFLQAAGKAIGVNPDRRLRAVCISNHWPTI